MARWLVRTKKADHEADGYKQFLFPWHPSLAIKEGVREVTDEEAMIVRKGGKLPQHIPAKGLRPGYIMTQIPQVLVGKVNDLVNIWEDGQAIKLDQTADFPEIAMTVEKSEIPVIKTEQVTTKDEFGPEPGEGTRGESFEEVKVGRMKSVNSIEKYAADNFSLELDRATMSIDDMKQEVLKHVKQRESEKKTEVE